MKPRSRKSRLLGLLPSRLVVTRLPSRGKRLFLTFDDGPDPEHTPRILDILERHGATASFFLIGKQIARHPRIVQRIVSEGHRIGNHSWSHPLMTSLPLGAQIEEIRRTDEALSAFDGLDRHMFRPPCGALPANLLLHFAREKRTLAYWSYDSHDYERLPAEALLPKIRSTPPRSGDVILMHDDNMDTVDVLAHLLPEWVRHGFSVQAMPEPARAGRRIPAGAARP